MPPHETQYAADFALRAAWRQRSIRYRLRHRLNVALAFLKGDVTTWAACLALKHPQCFAVLVGKAPHHKVVLLAPREETSDRFIALALGLPAAEVFSTTQAARGAAVSSPDDPARA